MATRLFTGVQVVVIPWSKSLPELSVAEVYVLVVTWVRISSAPVVEVRCPFASTLLSVEMYVTSGYEANSSTTSAGSSTASELKLWKRFFTCTPLRLRSQFSGPSSLPENCRMTDTRSLVADPLRTNSRKSEATLLALEECGAAD